MKKNNWPKNVKIGYFDYKIIYSDTLVNDQHGITNSDNKEITIFKSNNIQAVKSTLLHEILHAVLEEISEVIWDLDSDLKNEEKEEKLIRLLEPKLMTLFSDNPSLMKLLTTKG